MSAPVRLAVVIGVLLAGLCGWILAGYPGATAGLVVGLAVGAIRWRRQPI